MTAPAPLRFGLLGTGNIAAQFTEGVAAARRSAITAVASRQPARAAEFARAFRLAGARTYGDYAALLRDPDVDAVYVALPNTLHHAWTLAALAAGKHVLCEKPLAATAVEAEEMFAAAARHGLLLVEGFMYRAHPQTRAVFDAVARGAIGPVRLVRASFCFRIRNPAGNIRMDPALAGGALMDLGCYCVNLARALTGEAPARVHAVGHLDAAHGVDTYTAGVLQYPSGAVATFACGMAVQADNAADVCGPEGFLEVPVPWKPGTRASFHLSHNAPPRMELLAATGRDKPPGPPPRETFTVETDGVPLFGLEADAFARSVREGAPLFMPPDETLANLRVLDELRRQIGLSY